MDQSIITISIKVPCYLIKIPDGFILIDTGDKSDQGALEKALDQTGVTPKNLKLVILTHGDFDHSGNATFLHQKYGVGIAIHADDAGIIERGDQNWNRKEKSDRISLFGRIIIFISTYFVRPVQFNPFKPDLLIEDGQDLTKYGFDAQVLHIPGHSKGSIGILTKEGNLFCGDLLMNMIKPDFHFMIDNYPDCIASIKKLKELNIKMVYPGHGKPFPFEQFIHNHQNLS